MARTVEENEGEIKNTWLRLQQACGWLPHIEVPKDKRTACGEKMMSKHLEMLNLINFRLYNMIGGCPDHEEIGGTEMDFRTVISKKDH